MDRSGFARKRLVLVVASIALAVAALVAFGPRAEVDHANLRAPELPADLDAYFEEGEARVPTLRSNAAKTIVWRASPGVATPLALVYLHGFSASREETRPLCDDVAAALGANLFYARLTGHGRDADAMADARVEDWLRDGLEALAVGRRIGERVVLVGTSTGGSLALWLAANDPERIAAMVLISPNLGPHDARSEMLLWPWGAWIARAVVGANYAFQVHSAEHAACWTTEFPSSALVTMMALVDLVRADAPAAVRAPTLTLYSPTDRVVSVAALTEAHAELGADTTRLLAVDGVGDPSGHVLAGRVLSPETTAGVAAAIVEFVDDVR